ncbi:hypothetical protein Q1695_004391 [Nippostrongylus brasiliensis]|nr:hypothetical protein Q1695_004391 [Nippostrongylus brasiliensis]
MEASTSVPEMTLAPVPISKIKGRIRGLDGALALKDVECAYFDETFCFYTKLAYKQARWSFFSLRMAPSHRKTSDVVTDKIRNVDTRKGKSSVATWKQHTERTTRLFSF